MLILEEAAARVKVAVKTMREWLRTGKLKGLKAGRLWRARTSDLERFFEEFAERLMAVPWVVERRLQGRVHEW